MQGGCLAQLPAPAVTGAPPSAGSQVCKSGSAVSSRLAVDTGIGAMTKYGQAYLRPTRRVSILFFFRDRYRTDACRSLYLLLPSLRMHDSHETERKDAYCHSA